MHFTLRQLGIFEAVAHHGNYTRAAEELFLSQPAVSQQVRQLEQNTGIALFDSVGKRMQLTQAGEELLRYAVAVREQLNEAAEVLDALKGMRGGRLSVSVASTANHFATRLLAAFAYGHPEIDISLDVTNRKGLLDQLEGNSCDLVLMGRPPKEMDLEAEIIMDNPLVIIAATDHPLAGQRAIPIERMTRETFVVRERDSGTRIALEQFFGSHGIHLRTGMEMRQNEAIKQAVEAGLGLGIVSLHTMELELETHRLVVLDVEDFPIARHWFVVHRRGKRLSPLAQAFKQFVIDHGSEYVRLPSLDFTPV